MQVPESLRYATSHEWVSVTDGIATIGVTDHAQAELTDVVYLELPTPGKQVKAGDAVAVIESVKAANDIYTPVSGEVVEFNPNLETDPSAVNQAPYTDGWMFRIRLSDPGEIDKLLTPAEYQSQIS
ncbi:MAG: glycine cleavage system protein GcvH [Verrucomicrobiales bacterium]|nr:glycine cleavage system protein GcvH [Verrucomicrobiae bacterium]MCP5553732.1 glycine cleavage system protein GcvH [Akkermansiaceae bacterium]